MTGIFVRICRNGTFQNLEFDQLTEQEMKEFARRMDPDQRVEWIVALAKWIQENVQEAKS